MVIAADVFLGGMALLPPIAGPAAGSPPAPPPGPPAALAPAPLPPPTPPAAPDAAGQPAATAAAAHVDGARGTVAGDPDGAATAAAAATPDAGTAAPRGGPTAAATPADDAAPRGGPADRRRADSERTSDKDTAREAWRRNLPDITTDRGKSSILIPIRGSTEGATYHVTNKPRAVLVTLPKAESMITMQYYRIKHDGFHQLWIKQGDAEGTTLRVVLEAAFDPQVEIKDDFVRVTVRRPEARPSAAAPEPAAPEPAPDGAEGAEQR